MPKILNEDSNTTKHNILTSQFLLVCWSFAEPNTFAWASNLVFNLLWLYLLSCVWVNMQNFDMILGFLFFQLIKMFETVGNSFYHFDNKSYALTQRYSKVILSWASFPHYAVVSLPVIPCYTSGSQV